MVGFDITWPENIFEFFFLCTMNRVFILEGCWPIIPSVPIFFDMQWGWGQKLWCGCRLHLCLCLGEDTVWNSTQIKKHTHTHTCTYESVQNSLPSFREKKYYIIKCPRPHNAGTLRVHPDYVKAASGQGLLSWPTCPALASCLLSRVGSRIMANPRSPIAHSPFLFLTNTFADFMSLYKGRTANHLIISLQILHHTMNHIKASKINTTTC